MIVLDANAAIAMALGSEYGRALEGQLLEGETVLAPALLFSEVTHGLVKYVRAGCLGQEEAVACGRDAVGLVDRFCDDGELWIEAMGESVRLGHSSYDLFYVVLARRTGATLFTLDKKLQDLNLSLGVNSVWLTKLEGKRGPAAS